MTVFSVSFLPMVIYRLHCPTDDVTVWVVGDCIITLVTIDEKEGLKTLIWT